jgi:hypothetical protein
MTSLRHLLDEALADKRITERVLSDSDSDSAPPAQEPVPSEPAHSERALSEPALSELDSAPAELDSESADSAPAEPAELAELAPAGGAPREIAFADSDDSDAARSEGAAPPAEISFDVFAEHIAAGKRQVASGKLDAQALTEWNACLQDEHLLLGGVENFWSNRRGHAPKSRLLACCLLELQYATPAKSWDAVHKLDLCKRLVGDAVVNGDLQMHQVSVPTPDWLREYRELAKLY